MQRFFAILAVTAFTLALGTTGAYAADETKSAAAGMTTCPTGQKWVKGYTKKDGTQVAGHCRVWKSKRGADQDDSATKAVTAPNAMSNDNASMAAKACPPGKSYVKGYTKKDGTKVEGYCRKKHKE